MQPTPKDGALKVKLSSQGVIFQSMGERFFSDSEWGNRHRHLIQPRRQNNKRTQDNFLINSLSVKTSHQPFKAQPQSILSYNPTNAEKAQQTLTMMVRERAVYEQSRNKRGLAKEGGKTLNWLFGVSTTEKLDKVNNQITKLSTETTAIFHALKTHTTLIHETIWELHANKETTDALQRSCLTLDKELNNARRTINNLTPQMQAVIAEIKTQLPTGWALTPATQGGDMWKPYQEAAVTAATIENGVRLFIHIPIFEFSRALTLYRVISLARATTNGSTSLKTMPFMKRAICPISQAVSRKNSKGACGVVIFLADNHRIQDDCTVLVTPWTGQEAEYLGHRRWGLSATNATRLIVTCPRQTAATQLYMFDTLAISIFEIPMACTAQSDDWIFQTSFRKDTRRQWITRTTQHLADLKTPGQPPQLPMITTKDDMSTQHTEMTTDMVQQMDGLFDLEHARLNIDGPQTHTRYPWEWIGILIPGVAIAVDPQLQALEHRLQLHEQVTSPDGTE
ncbi:hypothetical protein GHT06_015181 [Daphnia sinensis]|uniref:Uncharacterized protein n=1 Tax=Daphnia sinensis TaxID=1820382 RepID=A0AAD5L949_9CRUS|nr:hypothetical protein GHT06_015181 [Daphnia sinensis]